MRVQYLTETEQEDVEPDECRQENEEQTLLSEKDSDDAGEKGGDAAKCGQQAGHGQCQIAGKSIAAALPAGCEDKEQNEKQDHATNQPCGPFPRSGFRHKSNFHLFQHTASIVANNSSLF